MFSSKFLQLRGSVAKVFADNVWVSHRFSSAVTAVSDQPSTEPGIPDKLYKKVEIEVRGNEPAVMRSFADFVLMAAKNLDIKVTRHLAPKKAVHQRETVLKSVHIYKKHRVQYETRTYFRYLDLAHLTGSTADTFLEYVQRNLPEGVAMKVTKVEIQKRPESVDPPTA